MTTAAVFRPDVFTLYAKTQPNTQATGHAGREIRKMSESVKSETGKPKKPGVNVLLKATMLALANQLLGFF